MKKDEITIPIKWLKHIGYFLVESVVVFTIVIFGIHFFNSIPSINPTHKPDSLAVANNFMVFVTFIVVVATVLITLGAMYFTKEFSRDKKLILKENLEDLKEEFLKNKEIRDQFIELLLKDQKTIVEVDERLNALSKTRLDEIEFFKNEIKKQQRDEMKQLEDRIFSKLRELQESDTEVGRILKAFKKDK